MALTAVHPQLVTMAAALDDIEVAACAFGDDDCTLLWNRTFLRFFPEHVGQVRVGEPYRDNLRRFFDVRLAAERRPEMERLIDEGVARHRSQLAPHAFEHRGRRLRVASLGLPGGGRVRVWAELSAAAAPSADGSGHPTALQLEGVKLFEYMADGVMVTDPLGCLVWANETFASMYGLQQRSTVIGESFDDIYRLSWRGRGDGPDDARLQHGLALLAEGPRAAGSPVELPLPGDRWVRVVEHRSPEAWGYLTHVDISELKRQHQLLREAEQRSRDMLDRLHRQSQLFDLMLERMEQGVMLVNAERVVEVCNRRAVDLLGLPPELMASKPSFAQVLAFQWATDEFVHTPGSIQDFVRAGGILDQAHRYDRPRPDGRVIEIHSVPIEGGSVLRTYTDITERKRSEERIRHVARHDGLTSLATREVFREHLLAAMAACARSGDGFAVHFLDLNRFKPVNDRLGHAVGDQVLALVAARLRAVARDIDIVARMGGDEFAILQHHVTQTEGATTLARRVLDQVAQPMDIEGSAVQVGAAIGIALHPRHGQDVDSLLRHADSAMYRAKAGSRDAVCVCADADATPPASGQPEPGLGD
jgi:diguanylate cyclase (GGDEF)-like protein